MQRTKPFLGRETRAAPYSRGNPDAPGSWKHDLHPAGNGSGGLSNRISSQTQYAGGKAGRGASTLLARLSTGPGSQKGQELLLPGTSAPPGAPQMHGYGATLPAVTTNLNAGYELFPGTSTRGADGGVQDPTYDQRQPGQGAGRPLGRSVFTSSLVAAGLSEQAENEKRRQRELQAARERQAQQVSIMGVSKIWVRVENLAQGTTPEDVQVSLCLRNRTPLPLSPNPLAMCDADSQSAFAPSPIISARIAQQPSSNSSLVSIELEYSDRAAAEELVSTYNGVVADGNTLKVAILPSPGLASRLGGGGGIAGAGATGGPLGSRLRGATSAGGRSGVPASAAGKELLTAPSGSKMYSDTILRTDPNAKVTTLSDPPSGSAAQRQDAWARSGGQPLSQRVGGGRAGGRGW